MAHPILDAKTREPLGRVQVEDVRDYISDDHYETYWYTRLGECRRFGKRGHFPIRVRLKSVREPLGHKTYAPLLGRKLYQIEELRNAVNMEMTKDACEAALAAHGATVDWNKEVWDIC